MSIIEKSGLLLFILGLLTTILMIVVRTGSVLGFIVSFSAMIIGGFLFLLGAKS
jgi:hypothetical protein